MKMLLIPWMLLLFGVSLNSGHYIRKLEDADSQVYRVVEDRSGVRFVNPKAEKPTLREIVYYHIVERAFGKEEPANGITERSFTNSHGLQFLKDTDDASSETEQIDNEHDEEYKDNNDREYEENEHKNILEDEIQNEGGGQEKEADLVTEAKPLTEKDVKEAYKHRSYLFDQLRQTYSPVRRMILPETSSRRKTEASLEEIPNAPELPERSPNDAYMPQKTYGMNLDSDGGYVWNNLNNPPVYYEVGQSTENPNQAQGQSASGQNQETQPPAEANVPQLTENTDSGSSEDIYVGTDRLPATPLENQGVIEEKPENESEGVEESEEPVYNPNEKLESAEALQNPIEPIVNDESVPEDYNPGVEKPEFENPEKPGESGEPIEKPADSGLETAASSTESSEREEAKEAHEQTDNPFINPQLDPEDQKKIEDIFATAQPVEDIPKTYGMNLTGDSGHVWNNLNNPPVYYEVGQSTENPNQAQGQSASGQNQETPAEANVPQLTENTDSGSSEDIYVGTDRLPATPLENQGVIEEKPENELEGVEESEEPVYNPNEKLESAEALQNPIEPIVNDESVPEDYNPGVENPEFDNPEKPGESGEPIEKPADSGLETAASSTESSEREEAKVIPEAPTLPPLNFDNLPDYIRDAISSTEKSEAHEQTDNPFMNPQLDPEDKKKIEEKIEDIFATAQPVEDIPKTYGMNLTGDSGHVWNDMVNPPLSHDVGQTDKKEEEPKAPEPTEQTNQESLEEPKPEERPELENPENKETEVLEIPKVPEFENPEEKVPEIPELENPEEKVPEIPEFENPEEKVPEIPEFENPEEKVPEIPEFENPEEKVPEIPELENPEEKVPEIPELENPEEKVPEIPELQNPEEKVPEIPELENPEEKVPEITELENPEEKVPEIPELENPEEKVPEIPELENPEEKVPEITELENPEEKVPEIPEFENPEEKVPEIPELENPEEKETEIPDVPKLPESENPEEKEVEVPVIPGLENPEPVPENPDVEDKPAELPIEPTPEDKEPSLEPGSSQGDIPSPDNSEETGDVLPEHKPEEEKKPDIMSELLKSDAFWKWLGEWTATYMELLEKHMRKIAIQEICNHEKSGTDMCLLTEEPDDTGVIIKNGKVILDGKEIPVTHNSNFDGLRRGNKNNKEKDINKVEATTIYGNSVGNEKVNNVFIFNGVDAKEVLEELKPGNDSKIDFIIYERGKEREDEHKVEDKIEDKIEVPNKSEEIEKPIKEQKEIEDKPISSELESDIVSTEKVPLEEDNKS